MWLILCKENTNVVPWKTAFSTSHKILYHLLFSRPSSYLRSPPCSAELAVKPSSELNCKQRRSHISVENILSAHAAA